MEQSNASVTCTLVYNSGGGAKATLHNYLFKITHRGLISKSRDIFEGG